MSKRLLLKSVLLVSTVAPVMASYADNNTPNQNSGIFSQESKKVMQDSSPNPTLTMPKNTTEMQNNGAINQNNQPKKAEESEEMD